jgi:hypothetical protein
LNRARCSKRCHDSRQQADRDRPSGFAHDQAHDVDGTRAHCNPNPDLAVAFADRARQQTKQANRGQHQRRHTKRRRERRSILLIGDRPTHQRPHRLD